MPPPSLLTRPFLNALIVAATAAAAAPAIAADPGMLASPEYRLNIESYDAFRLASGRSSRPFAQPGSSEHAAVRLADKPFADQIEKAARESALDPALVHALIYVESRYQPAARSPKGALGLMQVLPDTASRYGVANAGRSVEANLKAGTRYLRDLMSLFEGRLELALAAYNAGENAVLRHGQSIPPYRETRLYVPAVLDKYREWRSPAPGAAALPRRVEYLPGTLLDSAFQSDLPH
jgi:soluble lytic murein transglycosylase-like protein